MPNAFSAMTSDRVYRRALTVEAAWDELHTGAGSQFDPEIVRLFEQVVVGRLAAPGAALPEATT